MKRILPVLSIMFIFISGFLLTACGGENKVNISLSTQNVEIELTDEGENKAIVYCDVTGTDNTRVFVSPTNSNIIVANEVIQGRNVISITALKGGNADVEVRAANDKVEYIHVFAYRDISSMSKKQEFSDRTNFFVVKNLGLASSLKLDANNYITFDNKATAERKGVKFSLLNEEKFASIEDNVLTLQKEFDKKSISILATSVHKPELSVELELLVIEDVNNFVVKNMNETLVEGSVVSISRNGSENGHPSSTSISISVYSPENEIKIEPEFLSGGASFDPSSYISYQQTGKTVENGVYTFTFMFDAQGTEKYGNINFRFKTMLSKFNHENHTSIYTFSTYDVVTALGVAGKDGYSQDNLINYDVYTTYVGDTTQRLGHEFTTTLLPTTVPDANSKFVITAQEDPSAKIDIVGKKGVAINFTRDEVSGTYISNEIANGTQIYIKAKQTLTVYATLNLNFVSVQSPTAKQTIKLNLYKAADALNINADGEVFIASDEVTTRELVYVLEGTNSINGLTCETSSSNFTLSAISKIRDYVEDGKNFVEFKVSITSVKGSNASGTFIFKHKNGAKSKEVKVTTLVQLSQVEIDFDKTSGNYGFAGKISGAAGEDEKLKASIWAGDGLNLNILPNAVNGVFAEYEVKFGFLSMAIDRKLDGSVSDLYKNFELKTNNEILAGASEITSEYLTVEKLNGKCRLSVKGEGKVWVVATLTGKRVNALGNIENVEFKRVFLVESYIPISSLSLSPETVALYTLDTIGSQNESLSKKSITLKLREDGRTPTYGYVAKVNGDEYVAVTNWQNNGHSITFDVQAKTSARKSMTFKSLRFEANGEFNFKFSANLNVKIKDADKVESVTIQNVREKIELDLTRGQTSFPIISSIAPDNSFNKNLKYYYQGKLGESDLIRISEKGVVSTKPNANLGGTGDVYIFPADMIAGDFYMVELANGSIESRKISEIGAKINNSLTKTYFDELMELSFTNNNGVKIAYSNVVKKISVKVADGITRETAVSIYSVDEFKSIKKSWHYELTLNLTLNGWDNGISEAFRGFEGGLYGKTEDITITLAPLKGEMGTLNSMALFNELKSTAHIEDLVFMGEVDGNGFVANVNKGLIKNVKVDTYSKQNADASTSITSSKVNSTSNAGAFVGENHGIITNSYNFGTTITSTAEMGYVGGIAGVNYGAILKSNVEFYVYAKEFSTLSGAYVGAIAGLIDGGSEIRECVVKSYVDAQVMPGAQEMIGETKGIFGEENQGIVTPAFVDKVYIDANLTNSFESISKSLLKDADKRPYVLLSNIYYMFNPSEEKDVVEKYVVVSNSNAIFSTPVKESEMASKNLNSFISADAYSTIELDNTIWFKNSAINGNIVHMQRDGKPMIPDQMVGDLDAFNIQNTNISIATTEKNIMLLMLYKEENTQLSYKEKAEIENMNTLTLAKLFGDEAAKSLRVVSSNGYRVATNGMSLTTKNLGEVSLKVTSKQNYTIERDIQVMVVYKITKPTMVFNGVEIKSDKDRINVKIGRKSVLSSAEENEMYFESKLVPFKTNTIGLEFYDKFKSADSYKPSAYITSGEVGAHTIETTNDFIDKDKGIYERDILAKSYFVSRFPFNAETTNQDVQTELYNNAIKDNINQAFILKTYNGANSITVTPASIDFDPMDIANIETTIVSDESDEGIIFEIIDEKGFYLTSTEQKNYEQIFSIAGENAIKISYNKISEEMFGEGSFKTFKFDVFVSIVDGYKSKIKDTLAYTVRLVPKSLYNYDDAKTIKADVAVKISEQELVRIDFAHNAVDYDGESVDGGVTYYKTNFEPTNVLSPRGRGGILTSNLYPSYANYDFVEVTTDSIDGKSLMLNNMVKTEKGFKKDLTDVEDIVGGYRINKRLDERINGSAVINNGLIYTWIKPTSDMKIDTMYSVHVRTYDKGVNGGKILLESATYNLSVTYLASAEISIDGETEVVRAKGTTSNLEITVNLNQNLDSITLLGARKGVLVSDITVSENASSKTKTYKAKLNINYNAELDTSHSDGKFRVNAKVSRMVSGVLESTESFVTVELVDFMLDNKNTHLNVATDEKDTLRANIGINKEVGFDFAFSPAQYDNIPSEDEEMRAAVEKLKEARAKFIKNGTYKSNGYIINPVDSNGVPTSSIALATGTETNLLYNMYFVSGNTETKVLNVGQDGKESFTNNSFIKFSKGEKGKIFVEGLRTGSVDLALRFKIVYPSGSVYEFVYKFKITVNVYTDEDKPKIISSEEEFLRIQFETDPADYILTSNLTFKNYIPFPTDKIKSLDGNNKIITIDSFSTATTESTLNLALFTNVAKDTTLKNISVNIYKGGQIAVDLTKFTAVNIAGLAINNYGLITNCETIIDGNSSSTTLSNPGFDVSYFKGSTPQHVSSDMSKIAGLIVNNYGNITNSRVGGLERGYLSSTNTPGSFSKESRRMQSINIKGQGRIAGVVVTNSGSISSSYFANGKITNEAIATLSYSSGFVIENNSKIALSYAEGFRTNEYGELYQLMGGGISTTGIASGFVTFNNAIVEDCYTNLKISTDKDKNGRLGSGFVYFNNGTVKRGYSASVVEGNNIDQMNFSGINEKGEWLNTGKIEKSYYYTTNSVGDGSMDQEKAYASGAMKLYDPTLEPQFYGFNFNSGNNAHDGIWEMTTKGPKLVSANNIAISHRYFVAIAGSEDYSLPYAIGYEYGSKANPAIIRDAKEYNNVFGDAKEGTAISNFFNKRTSTVFGSYRLVKDIDLKDLAQGEDQSFKVSSANMNLTAITGNSGLVSEGLFDGNGFAINNVELAGNEMQDDFGLFKTITSGAIVMNLTLDVKNVRNTKATNVGALTGTLNSAKIANINLSQPEDTETISYGIQGRNLVGGVVGRVLGYSTIANINVKNMKVQAVYNNINYSQTNRYVRGQGMSSFEQMSYAGGVAGFIDIFTDVQSAIKKYDENAFGNTGNVLSIESSGNFKISASTVGGLIGYTHVHTFVQDAVLIVNGENGVFSQKLSAYNEAAGGIVGENHGKLYQIKSEHDAASQLDIEKHTLDYYTSNSKVNRGNETLFIAKELDYSPKYIGGLVGYTRGGSLGVSYSKVNVVNLKSVAAGGLIGYIDFLKVAEKNAQITESIPVYDFEMREVYAFGDVKANTNKTSQTGNARDGATGGLVGAMNAHVKMERANSVNYFSNDFNLDELKVLDTENNVIEYNLSNLGIYSFIGKYVDPEKGMINGDKEDGRVSNVVLEMKDGSNNKQGKESYGIFKIMSEGTQVKISSDTEHTDKSDGIAEFYEMAAALHGISNVSPTGGDFAPYFINGDWDENNWAREKNELFPHMLYHVDETIIYIRTENDMSKLKDERNKNKVFIIIGNESSGMVDIRSWQSAQGNNLIANFEGVLKGYDTSGKYGLIMYPSAIFGSTLVGANFNNFTLDYRATSQGQSKRSAFVEDASGTTFTNLSLLNPHFSYNDNAEISSLNVGILTASAKDSSFDLIRFVQTTGEVPSLMVSGAQIGGTLNAGFITGQLSFAKSYKSNVIGEVYFVKDSDKSTIGPKINVEDIMAGTNSILNVGGLVGEICRGTESDLQNKSASVQIRNTNNLSITLGTDETKTFSKVNVGGYIGNASVLSSMSTTDKEQLKIENAHINITELKTQALNAGLVIGTLSNTSAITLNGGYSSSGKVGNGLLSGQISSTNGNANVASANIGGVIGHTTSEFTINSLTTDFVVGQTEKINKIADQEYLNEYGIVKNTQAPLKISGNANVGGYIGLAENAVNINQNLTSAIADHPVINGRGAPISIQSSSSGALNVGGVLGSFNSSASVKVSNLIAKPSLFVTTAGNAHVGGILGSVDISNVENPAKARDAAVPHVTLGGLGDTNCVSNYSNILVDSTTAVVGGQIGYINNGNTTTKSLYSNYGVFGGLIQFNAGETVGTKTFTAGGLVGSITGGSSTSEINKAHTFGDIDVIYQTSEGEDSVSKADDTEKARLTAYTFGGIVGNAQNLKIGNSNTLTTNWNRRASVGYADNVGALVGNKGENVSFQANNYNHMVSNADENDSTYTKNGTAGVDSGIQNIPYSDLAVAGEFKSINDVYKKDGSKLNPQVVNNSIDRTIVLKDASGDNKIYNNGKTWLSQTGELTEKLHSSITIGGPTRAFAYIGNGHVIGYTGQTVAFDNLKTTDMVSGVVIRMQSTSDTKLDPTTNPTPKTAPFGTTNGIINASRAEGRIRTSGGGVVEASGFAMQMNDGMIKNCSSSVEIEMASIGKTGTELSEKHSKAAGLVLNFATNANTFVIQSYSLGNIFVADAKSMGTNAPTDLTAGTQVYSFVNGVGGTTATREATKLGTYIKNCYTISYNGAKTTKGILGDPAFVQETVYDILGTETEQSITGSTKVTTDTLSRRFDNTNYNNTALNANFRINGQATTGTTEISTSVWDYSNEYAYGYPSHGGPAYKDQSYLRFQTASSIWDGTKFGTGQKSATEERYKGERGGLYDWYIAGTDTGTGTGTGTDVTKDGKFDAQTFENPSAKIYLKQNAGSAPVYQIPNGGKLKQLATAAAKIEFGTGTPKVAPIFELTRDIDAAKATSFDTSWNTADGLENNPIIKNRFNLNNDLYGNGHKIKKFSSNNIGGFFDTVSANLASLHFEDLEILGSGNNVSMGGVANILNGGFIYDTKATGEIDVNIAYTEGNGSVGGIVGNLDAGKVIKVISQLNIRVTGADDVGGVVGHAGATSGLITRAYNYSPIFVAADEKLACQGIAGIAGLSYLPISYSYNAASILVQKDGQAILVGGVHAEGSAAIESCYNSGYVGLYGTTASGVVAGISADTTKASLTNLYNTGRIDSVNTADLSKDASTPAAYQLSPSVGNAAGTTANIYKNDILQAGTEYYAAVKTEDKNTAFVDGKTDQLKCFANSETSVTPGSIDIGGTSFYVVSTAGEWDSLTSSSNGIMARINLNALSTEVKNNHTNHTITDINVIGTRDSVEKGEWTTGDAGSLHKLNIVGNKPSVISNDEKGCYVMVNIANAPGQAADATSLEKTSLDAIYNVKIKKTGTIITSAGVTMDFEGKNTTYDGEKIQMKIPFDLSALYPKRNTAFRDAGVQAKITSVVLSGGGADDITKWAYKTETGNLVFERNVSDLAEAQALRGARINYNVELLSEEQTVDLNSFKGKFNSKFTTQQKTATKEQILFTSEKKTIGGDNAATKKTFTTETSNFFKKIEKEITFSPDASDSSKLAPVTLSYIDIGFSEEMHKDWIFGSVEDTTIEVVYNADKHAFTITPKEGATTTEKITFYAYKAEKFNIYNTTLTGWDQSADNTLYKASGDYVEAPTTGNPSYISDITLGDDVNGTYVTYNILVEEMLTALLGGKALVTLNLALYQKSYAFAFDEHYADSYNAVGIYKRNTLEALNHTGGFNESQKKCSDDFGINITDKTITITANNVAALTTQYDVYIMQLKKQASILFTPSEFGRSTSFANYFITSTGETTFMNVAITPTLSVDKITGIPMNSNEVTLSFDTATVASKLTFTGSVVLKDAAYTAALSATEYTIEREYVIADLVGGAVTETDDLPGTKTKIADKKYAPSANAVDPATGAVFSISADGTKLVMNIAGGGKIYPIDPKTTETIIPCTLTATPVAGSIIEGIIKAADDNDAVDPTNLVSELLTQERTSVAASGSIDKTYLYNVSDVTIDNSGIVFTAIIKQNGKDHIYPYTSIGAVGFEVRADYGQFRKSVSKGDGCSVPIFEGLDLRASVYSVASGKPILVERQAKDEYGNPISVDGKPFMINVPPYDEASLQKGKFKLLEDIIQEDVFVDFIYSKTAPFSVNGETATIVANDEGKYYSVKISKASFEAAFSDYKTFTLNGTISYSLKSTQGKLFTDFTSAGKAYSFTLGSVYNKEQRLTFKLVQKESLLPEELKLSETSIFAEAQAAYGAFNGVKYTINVLTGGQIHATFTITRNDGKWTLTRTGDFTMSATSTINGQITNYAGETTIIMNEGGNPQTINVHKGDTNMFAMTLAMPTEANNTIKCDMVFKDSTAYARNYVSYTVTGETLSEFGDRGISFANNNNSTTEFKAEIETKNIILTSNVDIGYVEGGEAYLPAEWGNILINGQGNSVIFRGYGLSQVTPTAVNMKDLDVCGELIGSYDVLPDNGKNLGTDDTALNENVKAHGMLGANVSSAYIDNVSTFGVIQNVRESEKLVMARAETVSRLGPGEQNYQYQNYAYAGGIAGVYDGESITNSNSYVSIYGMTWDRDTDGGKGYNPEHNSKVTVTTYRGGNAGDVIGGLFGIVNNNAKISKNKAIGAVLKSGNGGNGGNITAGTIDKKNYYNYVYTMTDNVASAAQQLQNDGGDGGIIGKLYGLNLKGALGEGNGSDVIAKSGAGGNGGNGGNGRNLNNDLDQTLIHNDAYLGSGGAIGGAGGNQGAILDNGINKFAAAGENEVSRNGFTGTGGAGGKGGHAKKGKFTFTASQTLWGVPIWDGARTEYYGFGGGGGGAQGTSGWTDTTYSYEYSGNGSTNGQHCTFGDGDARTAPNFPQGNSYDELMYPNAKFFNSKEAVNDAIASGMKGGWMNGNAPDHSAKWKNCSVQGDGNRDKYDEADKVVVIKSEKVNNTAPIFGFLIVVWPPYIWPMLFPAVKVLVEGVYEKPDSVGGTGQAAGETRTYLPEPELPKA